MLDAYQRGETAALSATIDELWLEIWRLGRQGFVVEVEGQPVQVEADEDLDRLERVTQEILAALLTPAARAQVSDLASLGPSAQAAAKARWLAVASADGRIHNGALSPGGDSLARLRFVEEAERARDQLLSEFDPRLRGIVEARFQKGLPAAEIGQSLGTGAASIRAQEERARRALSRALRPLRPGPATLDAIYAGRLLGEPPTITADRLRRSVLTRTFDREPRPYGVRLRDALVFAAVAALGYGLLYAGVLPGPGGDPVLEPKVEVLCQPACTAGAQATVRILAPKPSQRVALFRVDGGALTPFLVGPGGGALTIPFGARAQATLLPYPATLTASLTPDTQILAVLSEKRLSPTELHRAARGLEPDALVALAEVH